MRVLVCGGRDYADHNRLFAEMDVMREALAPREMAIIHGDASGADSVASVWASLRGVEEFKYRANWRVYGSSAGPIRNALMLSEGKPDVVVAFPGGKGTADMVAKARKAGVRVVEVGAF